MLRAVTGPTVRQALESLRQGGSEDRFPSDWSASVAALREGPDPDGALLRAQQLPEGLLGRPLPPLACALLHQGGYPARLLGLHPPAVSVATEASVRAPPGRDALLAELRATAHAVGPEKAIAQVRTREYLRLALLEMEGAALEAVGRALTNLVAASCQLALERAGDRLEERVVVVGMGKLGGDELNYLSDVDLVFLHADDAVPGGPAGMGPRNRLHDQLRTVVRWLEGSGKFRPLFRVDLRLRPYGSRGPMSMSLATATSYFERHGRDWERQAWLRAAPLAGRVEVGRALLRTLQPFVYRRSLSPEVFQEIRELMARARRASKAGLGDGMDLKHDPGGIRDVEFFVQGLQLLNGGRNPGLRVRGTLPALERLLTASLVSEREYAALTDAYRWLRRVEHRVQLEEGGHTHRVHGGSEHRALLAARLAAPFRATAGEERAALLAAFDQEASSHRALVAEITDTLRDEPAGDGLDDAVERRRRAVETALDPAAVLEQLEPALAEIGVLDPHEAAGTILALRERPDSAFAAQGRTREGAERLLAACLDAASPNVALRRLSEFASHRPRHYGAWQFLADPAHGDLARRLAELLGSSDVLSRGLVGLPPRRGKAEDEALTMLLDAREGSLPTREEQRTALSARLDGDADAPLEVSEVHHALLRFKHRQVVRMGLFDLARRPDPLVIGRVLADLADLTIATTATALAGEHARGRRSAPPFDLCVLALGKLGMQAMDYGSDLDLVFVFDVPEGDALAAREAALHVTRRLVATLQDRSLGAQLFEIDTRLRPSGRQGMLVSSLESFRRYHARPLPVWERLAQLRMRPVVEVRFDPEGDPDPVRTLLRSDLPPVAPGSLARAIHDDVLPPSVWPAHDSVYVDVAARVRELKRRIEEELARETRDGATRWRAVAPLRGPGVALGAGEARKRTSGPWFNVKTGVGGILELELLISALQLQHGRGTAPGSRVRARSVVEAMGGLLASGHMDVEEHARLVEAYRFERRLMNRLRMSQSGHAGTGIDDPDRFAVNSPRLVQLARRLGLTNADALVEAYLTHRNAVRAAFDRHLR